MLRNVVLAVLLSASVVLPASAQSWDYFKGRQVPGPIQTDSNNDDAARRQRDIDLRQESFRRQQQEDQRRQTEMRERAQREMRERAQREEAARRNQNK